MSTDCIREGIRRSHRTCHIGLFSYIEAVFKDDAIASIAVNIAVNIAVDVGDRSCK